MLNWVEYEKSFITSEPVDDKRRLLSGFSDSPFSKLRKVWFTGILYGLMAIFFFNKFQYLR